MQVKLPDLHEHWPLPRMMSPWHYEVTPGSADWTESFQIFSPAKQQKFRQYNVGILASFSYPHHLREHLRIACDFMNVLFVVDDVSDVQKPEEVRDIAKIAMDALRNPGKKRPESEHPIGELHRSFWSNAIKSASDTSRRRFVDSYEQYLNAVVTEAEDRDNHSIRKSIEDYLPLRRFSGGVKPSFDLLLLPSEIPDSVLLDPRIVELEYMAIDLIAVANDVVSFNFEHARGDIHNAVIVVMKQHNLSPQDALDHVNEWYRQRAKQFLKAAVELPACPDHKTRDQLRTYVWSLGNWVTANYEWSFTSKRFFGSEIESVKESGMVVLLPQSKETAVSA